MSLPKIAIVGRPNVGKSSLLNSLAGSMISIVEATPGVTRDRISILLEYEDIYFELVDTGGYGIFDNRELSSDINSQIDRAVKEADLVVFLVDIREGLTPLDEQIARLLRKNGSNVLLAANKADDAGMFSRAVEFMSLGFGEAVCVSAANNLNKSFLLEKITEKVGDISSEKPKDAFMKIAVVGKRNAGKSSFVNAVLGEERMIVSEVEGTTRDAVDVRFIKDGYPVTLIDTAGVRKKGKMSDSIEYYSYTRAEKSIRRADVVLFMIDAVLPSSQVDKKLARMITDYLKPCIFVINKWDKVLEEGYDAEPEDFSDYLTETFPGLRHAPIAFTTATEGRNISSTLDLAKELYKQSTMCLPTSKLNEAMEVIRAQRTGKSDKGVFPKIYYATQVSVQPVSLLIFVNRPDLFDENYKRFMLNRLRDLLPVSEVPIKLMFRQHHSDRRQPGKESRVQGRKR
ncbi:GTP-binding protein EngA [Sedimentisphaera cyanobacteriorum]|uniref:GTPase Der n=1 Tax=Sedimentisphaera cyanobacteriorum TaxID=1940790 RepID=A0A1Q2HS73_9BACT|nr:ribosome biogenesis GTPase Der [Sedimentisphaera cyanobacteriorum]AQQ10282.1 GTP-binding protein EngA [Sedimentisphaera cyanobacteriorum]